MRVMFGGYIWPSLPAEESTMHQPLVVAEPSPTPLGLAASLGCILYTLKVIPPDE